MSTIAVAPLPFWRFFDRPGAPLALGRLWTYVPGTTTPQVVYRDYAQTVAWPNPILLTDGSFPGGAGYVPGLVFPPISTPVKYALQDALGNPLIAADSIPTVVGSDIAANNWLPFTPLWFNGSAPPTFNVVGNGVLLGYSRMTGPKTVEFLISLNWGSTTVAGPDIFYFGNMPGFPMVGERTCQVYAGRTGLGAQGGIGHIFSQASSSNNYVILYRPQAPNLYASTPYSPTVPFTWTVGDFLGVHGSYEVA